MSTSSELSVTSIRSCAVNIVVLIEHSFPALFGLLLRRSACPLWLSSARPAKAYRLPAPGTWRRWRANALYQVGTLRRQFLPVGRRFVAPEWLSFLHQPRCLPPHRRPSCGGSE